MQKTISEAQNNTPILAKMSLQKKDLEKTSVPSTLPHGHRKHGPAILIEFKQQNAPRYPVALVKLDLASQQHVALEQCGSQSS